MIIFNRLQKQTDLIQHISLALIYLIITVFYWSWLTLTVSIFIFLTLFVGNKKHWFFISLKYILYPLAALFLTLFAFIHVSSWLGIAENSNFSSIFIAAAFFIVVPLSSIVLYLIKPRDAEFLNKLKVSIGFNNFIFFTILTLTLLILSVTSNLDSILPSTIVENAKHSSKSPEDFIALLINFVSFPFLVSNSLINWLVDKAQLLTHLNNKPNEFRTP